MRRAPYRLKNLNKTFPKLGKLLRADFPKKRVTTNIIVNRTQTVRANPGRKKKIRQPSNTRIRRIPTRTASRRNADCIFAKRTLTSARPPHTSTRPPRASAPRLAAANSRHLDASRIRTLSARKTSPTKNFTERAKNLLCAQDNKM